MHWKWKKYLKSASFLLTTVLCWSDGPACSVQVCPHLTEICFAEDVESNFKQSLCDRDLWETLLFSSDGELREMGFTSGLEPCGDDHNKKAPANQFQVLNAGKDEAK